MTSAAWELAHSVERDASPAFAWSYWTRIENWEDPPAKFELVGPFVAGARGNTLLPGQEPVRWVVREVTPPYSATIEIELMDATLSFEWRFAGLPDGRTQLTRRIVLAGEKANGYIAQVKTAFAANLSDGMDKLARAMAEAESIRKSRREKV